MPEKEIRPSERGDAVEGPLQATAHLDRSAEGDGPVDLTEVQVPDREVRSVDEHRAEHPAAPGEVLDVLVAAVLPRWGGLGGLQRHAGEVRLRDASQDGGLMQPPGHDKSEPTR